MIDRCAAEANWRLRFEQKLETVLLNEEERAAAVEELFRLERAEAAAELAAYDVANPKIGGNDET